MTEAHPGPERNQARFKAGESLALIKYHEQSKN